MTDNRNIKDVLAQSEEMLAETSTEAPTMGQALFTLDKQNCVGVWAKHQLDIMVQRIIFDDHAGPFATYGEALLLQLNRLRNSGKSEAVDRIEAKIAKAFPGLLPED